MRDSNRAAHIKTTGLAVLLLLLCSVWPLAATDPASVDRQNWMGEVFENKRHLRLGDIVIPGTHDTGTYDIDCESTLEAGAVQEPMFTDSVFLQWLLNEGVGIGCYAAGTARTQDRPIELQLMDGIRFLDLRVNVEDGDFVLTHTLVAGPLDDALAQIESFAAAHPKEIIILEIGKVPGAGHIAAFNNLFEAYLSPYMLPDSSGQALAHMTVEDIWSTGKNVIVIMSDGTYASSSANYWHGSVHIDNNWSNTESPVTLATDQKNTLDPREASKLTKTSLIMTWKPPTAIWDTHWVPIVIPIPLPPFTATIWIEEDIVVGFDMGCDPFAANPCVSLEDMAAWIDSYSRDYVPTWIDQGLYPNIVIVDFYEDTEVVEVAIEENLLLAMPGWLDRDNPGAAGDGNHDWEKLNAHSDDVWSIPDSVFGIEPAYVEMRRKSDHKDVAYTGDDFTLRTRYGGKVTNHSSNPASGDYEIRFHFGWTPWLSRDTPDASGDYEGHYQYTAWSNSNADFAGRMPQDRVPTRVECRAKVYPDVVFTHESPINANGLIEGDLGDGHTRLFWCNTDYGYKCNNGVNTSAGHASCIDVEVRYYFGYEPICEGNVLDGMDNGLCDASDGGAKIVSRSNSSLCLNVLGHGPYSDYDNVNTYDCGDVIERWRFNLETGKVHLASDPGMCLNVVGDRDAPDHANVNIVNCGWVSETWWYDESTGRIRAGWNSSQCLDAFNSQNSSGVYIDACSSSISWDIYYE